MLWFLRNGSVETERYHPVNVRISIWTMNADFPPFISPLSKLIHRIPFSPTLPPQRAAILTMSDQLTNYVESMRFVTVRDSTKLNEFPQADIGSSISMVGYHGARVGRQVLIQSILHHSRGSYDVLVRLSLNPWDGGGLGLVVKVDLYEVVIFRSAISTLRWLSGALLSVWVNSCFLMWHRCDLPSIHADQLSTTIDPTTCKMVDKARGGAGLLIQPWFPNLSHILFPVLMITGISLSERSWLEFVTLIPT